MQKAPITQIEYFDDKSNDEYFRAFERDGEFVEIIERFSGRMLSGDPHWDRGRAADYFRSEFWNYLSKRMQDTSDAEINEIYIRLCEWIEKYHKVLLKAHKIRKQKAVEKARNEARDKMLRATSRSDGYYEY